MTTNLPAIKKYVQSDSIQQSIRARLGDKAGTFTTSLLDLVGDTALLQQCDPGLVVKEALKAAALDLPINKSLGFAYVIPYKEKGVPRPQFQMGYKGFIQLAIRTGQYKHLNAGVVYEGEAMEDDRIKGTLQITGKKTSNKPIAYFAYMQLVNGFEKAIAWDHDRVKEHAQRFSKSYNAASSPWKTDFEAMALKTMLLQLIPKYGPMTIEMSTAISHDSRDRHDFEYDADAGANQEVIDIDASPEPVNGADEMTDEEKADIRAAEAAEEQAQADPGF